MGQLADQVAAVEAEVAALKDGVAARDAEIAALHARVAELSAPKFAHPGVFVDAAALDFAKAKIAAGQEPWKSALARVYGTGSSVKTAARPTSYRYSSLSYMPAPVSVILAPSASDQRWIDAHPQHGMKAAGDVEHLDDARACYTHALLWRLTDKQEHAAKAAEIMDAWSAKLTRIEFNVPAPDGSTERLWDNGKLQAGWGGSLMARAAELVRHSAAPWPGADRFASMLRDVHLPLTITGWSNGANWLMTLAEATIGIGVHLDDRAVFDAGVAAWRSKAPTTVYMPDDGPYPLPPDPYYDRADRMKALWYQPSSYLVGLQAETCRDLSHMAMGLGALANAAETARIQGVDLFGEERQRIVAGFERQARYVNEYLDAVDAVGAVPSTWRPTMWVGPSFSTGGSGYRRGWEVAHAHYVWRRGVDMPETGRVAQRTRSSEAAFLHMTWETLTHAR